MKMTFNNLIITTCVAGAVSIPTAVGVNFILGALNSPEKKAQEARDMAALTSIRNGTDRHKLCRAQFDAAVKFGAKLPAIAQEDITYDLEYGMCSTQGGTLTWQLENSAMLRAGQNFGTPAVSR